MVVKYFGLCFGGPETVVGSKLVDFVRTPALLLWPTDSPRSFPACDNTPACLRSIEECPCGTLRGTAGPTLGFAEKVQVEGLYSIMRVFDFHLLYFEWKLGCRANLRANAFIILLRFVSLWALHFLHGILISSQCLGVQLFRDKLHLEHLFDILY